jgi:hypothetical protein
VKLTNFLDIRDRVFRVLFNKDVTHERLVVCQKFLDFGSFVETHFSKKYYICIKASYLRGRLGMELVDRSEG